MIRVLHIVGAMNMGGIENFVMNVYRKIDRKKIQFDFLYITEEKCYFDDEIISLGGRIFRITAKSVNYKKHIQELKEILNNHKEEISVVHIHTATSLSYIDAKTAKECGINKVIIHSHNTSYCKKWLHYLFRPLLRKYGTHFFACSQGAGKWLFGKKYCENNSILIIKNGIESSKFIFDEKIRKKIREELSLEDKFIIGHVGRFNNQKNHDFLIDIFNEINKLDNNTVLMLIGEGNLETIIKDKVKKIGIEKYVEFMGVRDNINELMQAMDAFVFPSHYEGLPLTLIEAQASGLPCIISNSITDEVKITDLIHKVSLEESSNTWSKIVLDTNKDRKNYLYDIMVEGYDICNSVKELEKIYYIQENV